VVRQLDLHYLGLRARAARDAELLGERQRDGAGGQLHTWLIQRRRCPPYPAAPRPPSPSRPATAAASVRERTSSLARMRDTCTLAVFSAMCSSSPISRLVEPRATRARTCCSR